MIWTLEIKVFASDDWKATIEIDSSSTLEDLHFIIQDAVEFDNDHLYEFYVSRTERSYKRVRYDDENEGIYDITLDDLFPLEKNNKLFYLFDYGDHWLFRILKSRKKPHEPEKGKTYPHIVKQVGNKPEQYPDWEDFE